MASVVIVSMALVGMVDDLVVSVVAWFLGRWLGGGPGWLGSLGLVLVWGWLG